MTSVGTACISSWNKGKRNCVTASLQMLKTKWLELLKWWQQNKLWIQTLEAQELLCLWFFLYIEKFIFRRSVVSLFSLFFFFKQVTQWKEKHQLAFHCYRQLLNCNFTFNKCRQSCSSNWLPQTVNVYLMSNAVTVQNAFILDLNRQIDFGFCFHL